MSIVASANGQIEQACLFIIYSAMLDALDGVAARFTHTSSRFGVELDSLADVVSFGAAPSFLFYQAYFNSGDGFSLALSSLVMIAAALRLARFNTQLVGFDKNYFSGVPTPVSAITISAFFLFYFNKNFSYNTSEIFAYVLAILLPVLMLSKFKYDTLPRFSLSSIKAQPVKFIIILLIAALIAITKGEGLFAFCLFYLSTGIFRGIKNTLRKVFGPKRIHESAEKDFEGTSLREKFKSTN